MNHVRSRFRYLHVVHGLSNPLAKLSSRLTVGMCGIACSLPKPCTTSNHLRREVSRLHTAQETVPRLYPSLCRVLTIWRVSLIVFCLFIRAHTSLRMSGGAIPASKYRSSTLVGFRHPVTALHALFSSGFSFWA